MKEAEKGNSRTVMKAAEKGKAVMTTAEKGKAVSGKEKKDFIEDALTELESDKLYGMGSRQSKLSQFALELEDGLLNLFPDYQRAYVWECGKASRLICTALCNRFIPPLVLHEKSKGIFDVVDGKQRLASLLGFYMNRKNARLVGDLACREKMNKILPQLATLSKLDESYEPLNGCSFDDLSEDRQRAFGSYMLSYLVIPYGTPKPDVFEVYEDINSGGEDLTQQQVRRAVYHGPYMKMIDVLRETCVDFHAILNAKDVRAGTYEPCKKDSDGELILRAFAFRETGTKFKPSIKKFLNRELEWSADFEQRKEEEQRKILEKIDQQHTEFVNVMKIARLVFGDEAAFRKKALPSNKQQSISKVMWDAKYCAIAELLENHYEVIDFTRAKDAIARAYQDNLENGFFVNDDEKTTAKKFDLRRDELKRLIRKAVEESGPRDGRRTFPRNDLIEELYREQNGLCALCNQTIDESRLEDPNYVHIDHEIPHSKGGPTDRTNAQLTHRGCNLHKGAR